MFFRGKGGDKRLLLFVFVGIVDVEELGDTRSALGKEAALSFEGAQGKGTVGTWVADDTHITFRQLTERLELGRLAVGEGNGNDPNVGYDFLWHGEVC